MKKIILPILFILTIFLLGCENEKPAIADFSYEIDGQTVTFYNNSKNANGFSSWSFGDNTYRSFETDSVVTHKYNKKGEYNVSLKVSNRYNSSSKTKSIVINHLDDEIRYCNVHIYNSTKYLANFYIDGRLLRGVSEYSNYTMDLYERWETLKYLYSDMVDVESDVIGKNVIVEVGFMCNYPEIPEHLSKTYTFHRGNTYKVIIESTKEFYITPF